MVAQLSCLGRRRAIKGAGNSQALKTPHMASSAEWREVGKAFSKRASQALLASIVSWGLAALRQLNTSQSSLAARRRVAGWRVKPGSRE